MDRTGLFSNEELLNDGNESDDEAEGELHVFKMASNDRAHVKRSSHLVESVAYQITKALIILICFAIALSWPYFYSFYFF